MTTAFPGVFDERDECFNDVTRITKKQHCIIDEMDQIFIEPSMQKNAREMIAGVFHSNLSKRVSATTTEKETQQASES